MYEIVSNFEPTCVACRWTYLVCKWIEPEVEFIQLAWVVEVELIWCALVMEVDLVQPWPLRLSLSSMDLTVENEINECGFDC